MVRGTKNIGDFVYLYIPRSFLGWVLVRIVIISKKLGRGIYYPVILGIMIMQCHKDPVMNQSGELLECHKIFVSNAAQLLKAIRTIETKHFQKCLVSKFLIALRNCQPKDVSLFH